MTGDLKQRLREWNGVPDNSEYETLKWLDLLTGEAADRIEQLESERDELLAALCSVLSIDVKGYQFQDRMQFSSAGRAILDQCNAAIYRIKPKP